MDNINSNESNLNAAPEAIPQTGDAPGVSTVTLLSPSLQVETGDAIKLNQDGSIRRKPGRKPGQKSATVSGNSITPEKVAKTPAQIKAQTLTAEQTAKMMLNAGVGFMCELIGPEWDFQSEDEAKSLLAVTASYIDAKGGVSMSPEVVLLLALSGYAMTRTRHENTRSKIKAFFAKGLNALGRVFKR